MSQPAAEQGGRFRSLLLVGIALGIICGVSLYLRVALPHKYIFVGDAVWFRETDAYYHMRQIESLVHHFPHVNSFDPYVLYPGGGSGVARPFFDWLVAAIILLLSFGSPSQHFIEVVGAYMPAILGTLALIPMYLVGKELFNRGVGLISAALLAILPGEFLNRSLLGFTDHHVVEVLFSTTVVLFLIMAIKRAREREISFSCLWSEDRARVGRPLLYSSLAGIFLGAYLLSWIGGLMFVFIIFAYLVIQFLVDHLTGRSTEYLCLVGSPCFLVCFFMLLIFLGKGGTDVIHCVSLTIAVLVPIFLALLSRFMAARRIKPVFYPFALAALGGIGLAAFYALSPALLSSMLSRFSVFAPSAGMRTVLEVQPLNLAIAWRNFTTSFLLFFVSLGLLIYAAIKEKRAELNLLLVWSVVMLIAILSQRRFGYYFAVNVALFAGYFSWRMLELAGWHRLFIKQKMKVVKKVKKGRGGEERVREKVLVRPRDAMIKVSIVAALLFLLVFFPNVGYARGLADSPGLMTQGWYEALIWLRDNTPEPFGDPDFYYARYQPREEFIYPDTAYGVMSWWDYGYWIMQVAHRLPIANPGQARAAEAGRFFIAQNETSANELAEEFGVRYVMIDHAMPTTKFYAMPTWAGVNVSEFYEVYYQRADGGKLQPVVLYYPAYYRSMVVRLYNFNGQAQTPTRCLVVSYEEKITWLGIKYKEITSSVSFPSYESAAEYVARQETGNYRIVGNDPLVTPVPLEELKTYKLVYESQAKAQIAGKYVPSVKVFEKGTGYF